MIAGGRGAKASSSLSLTKPSRWMEERINEWYPLPETDFSCLGTEREKENTERRNKRERGEVGIWKISQDRLSDLISQASDHLRGNQVHPLREEVPEVHSDVHEFRNIIRCSKGAEENSLNSRIPGASLCVSPSLSGRWSLLSSQTPLKEILSIFGGMDVSCPFIARLEASESSALPGSDLKSVAQPRTPAHPLLPAMV